MTATSQVPDMTGAGAPGGLSAATILEALQNHYRKPGAPRDGEILLPEVTAPGSARRADLVRIGMWASRGVGIDVHEIKVSRADWLRELDDPAKAEAWWPYCNRFWVVAAPGIIRDGELPAGWGLLEFPRTGRRFKARVQADTRKDIRLTVPLLVELLRRADNRRLTEISKLREQHRDDVYRLNEEWRNRKAQGELSPALRRRLEVLEQVEKMTGMRLDQFGDSGRTPPEEITPGELAAVLTDARDHVTLQRRATDLARLEGSLIRAATEVLRRLDQAGTRETTPTGSKEGTR